VPPFPNATLRAAAYILCRGHETRLRELLHVLLCVLHILLWIYRLVMLPWVLLLLVLWGFVLLGLVLVVVCACGSLLRMMLWKEMLAWMLLVLFLVVVWVRMVELLQLVALSQHHLSLRVQSVWRMSLEILESQFSRPAT